MADRAAPMSSEAEAIDQRFRELRRTTPEWWRDVYISEYIGDEEPELTQAKEDFDAMIKQIEQRVLAQQPCYAEWAAHPLERCNMILAGSPSKWCPTCTACQTRAAQGSAQETSG